MNAQPENEETRKPRRMLPEQLADLVFPHIPFGPNARSGGELAHRSGLTLAQVYRAVEWIRESFPEDPLVATGKDGYCWTSDPQKVGAFQRWRATSAQTIVRRLWRSAIKPYLATAAAITEREREFTTRQFERLLEDIGTLIEA